MVLLLLLQPSAPIPPPRTPIAALPRASSRQEREASGRRSRSSGGGSIRREEQEEEAGNGQWHGEGKEAADGKARNCGVWWRRRDANDEICSAAGETRERMVGETEKAAAWTRPNQSRAEQQPKNNEMETLFFFEIGRAHV